MSNAAGRTRIFARAKPHHKTLIIENLIKQGRYVGMVSDDEMMFLHSVETGQMIVVL